MDNKLMNKDLVERYVLNQLNDEELALFRGQMMFDEELRKQVVETKTLIKGLQAIAKSEGMAAPAATSISSSRVGNSQLMLRAAAVVVGVLLIGAMTYYWSSSSNEDSQIAPIEQAEKPVDVEPQDNNQPIASEKTDDEEVERQETTLSPPPSNEARNATTPSNASQNTNSDENEEERIFASRSPNKVKSEQDAPILDDSEHIVAFADGSNVNIREKFDTIDYLEDAIDNSATRSKATQINVIKGENYSQARDENDAIHLDLKGSINTEKKNAQYIFKIYSNKSDEYEDNIPKYQAPVEVNNENGKTSFHIDFKIALQPGLYYYTIEEIVNGEKDMVYTHRIIVLK